MSCSLISIPEETIVEMRDVEAENKAYRFYEGQGWDIDEAGTTLDAKLWEDMRSCAAEYVSACRRRVLAHLPSTGNLLLDAASGPIQYPEYLEYSCGFSKHVCVDISEKALDQAKRKLRDRGEYVRASILQLPFPDNYFDATVSLHTIYHIDRHQQEAAVRQLIRVVKLGHPIVIVYSNPYRLLAILKLPLTSLRALLRNRTIKVDDEPLYFHAHSLGWWNRFSDQCDVALLPWRSLTAQESKRLIPNNRLGKLIFRWVLTFEDSFPRLATLLGAYPMIVLRKIC